MTRRTEVWYSIIIQFQVLIKLVRLYEICLNETYSKVRIGKYLPDNVPVQNGIKQGDTLAPHYFRTCH
jgi:hypothetical protein